MFFYHILWLIRSKMWVNYYTKNLMNEIFEIANYDSHNLWAIIFMSKKILWIMMSHRLMSATSLKPRFNIYISFQWASCNSQIVCSEYQRIWTVSFQFYESLRTWVIIKWTMIIDYEIQCKKMLKHCWKRCIFLAHTHTIHRK